MKKTIVLMAVAAVLLVIAPAAQAGVVWTFEEVGADVVATASGSFTLAIGQEGTNYGTATGSLAIGGAPNLLITSVVASNAFDWAYSTPGVGSTVAGMTTPDTWSGTFGHLGGTIYWDIELGDTLDAGEDVSSFTTPTATWNGTTLANVITGGLTTTPVTAWTMTGGAASDTITFVAVPEPATMSLLAIGGIALIRRRRRA
jgi:hypothetical protein